MMYLDVRCQSKIYSLYLGHGARHAGPHLWLQRHDKSCVRYSLRSQCAAAGSCRRAAVQALRATPTRLPTSLWGAVLCRLSLAHFWPALRAARSAQSR